MTDNFLDSARLKVLETNVSSKLNGGIFTNLNFLNVNYPKGLNFWNLRLAPLFSCTTFVEHEKYALRVNTYY